MGTVATGCDKKSSDEKPKEEPSTQQASEEPGGSTDQSRSGWTENETYYLEAVPEPNPIPFQKLFELNIRVLTSEKSEKTAEGVSLDQVQAIMPAHDHGMKTAPEVTEKSPGEFVVRGMKFHMQGKDEDGLWVVKIVVNGDDGIDEANFEYQCCTSR